MACFSFSSFCLPPFFFLLKLCAQDQYQEKTHTCSSPILAHPDHPTLRSSSKRGHRPAAWDVPGNIHDPPHTRVQMEGIHVHQPLVGVPISTFAAEHNHFCAVDQGRVAVPRGGQQPAGGQPFALAGAPVDRVDVIERPLSVAAAEDHSRVVVNHCTVEGPAARLVARQRNLSQSREWQGVERATVHVLSTSNPHRTNCATVRKLYWTNCVAFPMTNTAAPGRKMKTGAHGCVVWVVFGMAGVRSRICLVCGLSVVCMVRARFVWLAVRTW